MPEPVLLWNPPSSKSRKPVLPMSLLAVAAVLEQPAEIVDGNLVPDSLAALEARIASGGFRRLGVTVMPGPQLAAAVPVCRALKQRHPDLIIVWGGYFPTEHWEPVLRAGFVDYVVRGHGERVFADLLASLDRGDDPRELAGLAYLEAGQPQTNPLAPIPHPEQQPDFPYSLVELGRYVRRTFMGARTLAHHSSYGCPFFCNFCAVVEMVDGRWLAQSAARTAAIVERLVRAQNLDAIELYDNNFFVAEERTAEFSERITPLRLGWWGEARIDTLMRYSAATWRVMVASGLKMVFLGAESGSDEVLARMKKGGGASAAKTLELVARMRTLGVVPELSFVVGCPPDPEADVAQNIAFIRRVKKLHPDAEIVLYTYTPVPLAGDLLDAATGAGFRFPATLDEWLTPEWLAFVQRRSANIPWIKEGVRRRIRDFERVLHAAHPTRTDPRLTGWRRAALRAAASWRWALGAYRGAWELESLERVFAYRRPETTGF